MVRSVPTMQLCWAEINTIFKRIEACLHLTHVTKKFHRVPQNDFWTYSTFGANCAPILRDYIQTDQNELLFDQSHLGVPSSVPKMIPSLWSVRPKPCTYLASRLTLSPNIPQWASTWPTSPRSSIECPKKISMPMVCSSQTMHLSCIKINTIAKRIETSFYLTHVT
jgi:hypothetical protein